MDSTQTFLVLVENEVTVGGKYDHWKDNTGIQYHYPNQYLNLIQEGLPFVYYRGVRRLGGKRGTPEYFGSGMIGEIRLDPSVEESAPKASWKWFCDIEEYEPFSKPVPATDHGPRFENISSSMGWRRAVRTITWENFEAILLEANASGKITNPAKKLPLTPLDEHVQVIEILERDEALAPGKNFSVTDKRSANSHRRRSNRAKEIGDRAEGIIFRWLRKKLGDRLGDGIDWVAQKGLTPGWDIEYLDKNQDRVVLEVKGTTLPIFPNIELTANEWSAAKELGSRYILALVCEAHGNRPRIHLLKDPYKLFKNGKLEAEPTGWRIVRK